MNFRSIFSTQRYYRIAVSTFFFLQGLTFSSWTSRIPDIKNMLHLSDAVLGSVLFSMPMGQLLAMFLSGFLVSKFSSKKILIVAALAYPAALLTLGMVNHVWQLSAGLFVFGMFGNICNIAVNTQGVGVERIYKRSIMASFHGVWSLAGFTGGLISSVMAGNAISPFIHFCVIYAVALILVLTARNSILPRDGRKFEQTTQKAFVKPEKFIVLLGLISFGDMLCEGTMFNWSSIYFERVLLLPAEQIRIGFIAFMLTMSAGRFMADWLVTKFSVKHVIQTSGIIITTGMLLAVFLPSILPATIGFLLVGFGTSSVIPLCYSMAGKSQTMHPGLAVTTVSTIGFTGFLIAPPLVGFIAEAINLRWAFALVAIMGLLTTILANKLKM